MDAREIAELKAAWDGYLDALRGAADELFRPTTPSDPLTAAEGLRHLGRLTRMGLLGAVEYADPLFPELGQFVDAVSKFGCDNPDTIYQRALLDPAHRYRITGRRGTVDYLSFISARRDAQGYMRQVGMLDSRGLAVRPDGGFEITLSREPAAGNWLPMDAGTGSVSVRQTFLDRGREIPAELRIERLDAPDSPAPLTVERITAQLAAAAGFTRYCASTFTSWTEGYQAHANALPPADQDACLRAGGDPNIHFYRSFWTLASDEALVVRIPRIPACDAWNLQVDNYWQESMDYRHHRSHLNKHTARPDPDGGVTAVIAHGDPRHPNWLDTAGHRLGHFALRWIRADEHVDPMTRVVKVADLAALGPTA